MKRGRAEAIQVNPPGPGGVPIGVPKLPNNDPGKVREGSL